MVIDNINNAALYYGLGPQIQRALEYLQITDLAQLEPGKHVIQGDEIFAIVQDYQTKRRETAKWEAHRRYIDIQFIASGSELMGYANLESLRTITDYDESKDIIWLEGDGDFILAAERTFIILGPQDAHMPGIVVSEPSPVRKVVVKVRLRLALPQANAEKRVAASIMENRHSLGVIRVPTSPERVLLQLPSCPRRRLEPSSR